MTMQLRGHYRGFHIAVKPAGIKAFWRACWRERGSDKWTEGNLLAADAVDAERLAKECIDYDYRVAVWEFLNGRKYDAIADGFIPANDEPQERQEKAG